ncbi:MAG: hypothetical protein M1822_004008 [Bathelium mastoideum]|nr:MAG: hypothetical protein M1822_004008 [Bathelium mastoideum]
MAQVDSTESNSFVDLAQEANIAVHTSNFLRNGFWSALRQGIFMRAKCAKVPEFFYKDLLVKPARDCISILKDPPDASHTLAQEEIERWRLEIWRIFQTAFRLVVELHKGFPAECPDFRKGFHFSVLPMKVQNRIIGYVVPTLQTFGLKVKDCWPTTKTTASTTRYSLADERGNPVETTYIVRRVDSSETPPELVPFLTSKVHRAYLQRVQYADGIAFHGSPESASAFMHDRMGKLDLMTTISLWYWFEHARISNDDDLEVIPTNPRSWRKLSNILVHDCTGLRHLIIYVHSGFWDKIKWDVNGPDHYATATQLIRLPKKSSRETGIRAVEEDDRPCTFLEKIGRLSSEQVHLYVSIESADTADKKYFNMAVKLQLRHCMGVRPPLAEKKQGCRCNVKILRDSCAWEPPEAR